MTFSSIPRLRKNLWHTRNVLQLLSNDAATIKFNMFQFFTDTIDSLAHFIRPELQEHSQPYYIFYPMFKILDNSNLKSFLSRTFQCVSTLRV